MPKGQKEVRWKGRACSQLSQPVSLLYQIMAWKVIEYGGMSAIEKQQLVKEVNLLRELRHKHIVRYQDRLLSLNVVFYYTHIYV